MLSKKQLLGGKSFLPFEEVNLPELGGTIGVQGMTAGDAMAFYKIIGKAGKDGMDVETQAKFLVRCVVDEKRERVYEDDDWAQVMSWPLTALQKAMLVAVRLNNGSGEKN